jgi:hypothetical protein
MVILLPHGIWLVYSVSAETTTILPILFQYCYKYCYSDCRNLWAVMYQVRVITVFTVFRLLTDFVCLYTYEFWLSLCKIVRSSVILLLPLFIVFNVTFNNISVISWRSVLLVEETGENHRPATSHWQTLWQCCIEYTSPWTGCELTTLVVIGIDCTGSCKSNYRAIRTMTAPCLIHKSGLLYNWKHFVLEFHIVLF